MFSSNIPVLKQPLSKPQKMPYKGASRQVRSIANDAEPSQRSKSNEYPQDLKKFRLVVVSTADIFDVQKKRTGPIIPFPMPFEAMDDNIVSKAEER